MPRKKSADVPMPEIPEVKKKPGRRPMSPGEKLKAAKMRTEEKEKAANLKPEVLIQYQGGEVSMEKLIEAAKADFHQEKKRTLITALTLYVKPEEHMAYYVINGSYEGKIPY